MKTAAIKLTSPAAIRAACELPIAQGEQHAQVMYKSDDFEDDDYVGADLEEFASAKDDPEEFADFCSASRHSWELWVYEWGETGVPRQPGELNAPWSLHFDRDGTEDVAVILDANGEEFVRSRHFWRPWKDAATPATLAALLVMKAAPKLLESLHYLLEQTVDMDLKYGIELSEGEKDARQQSLAAIAEATDDSIGREA